MKYAFDNVNLIDGTQDMRVQPGLCVLTDGETITDIVPAGTAPAGYTRIDLHGRYLLPGLINMHVHLAGNGKIQKKQRDLETLVRRILSNPVSRAVAYRMVCSFARTELLGGVTTIRTVGGLDTFDTRLRDEIRAGRRIGPRVLAANEGISVPGGHMAGSVAIAARTVDEALAQVDAVHAQGADLVKLMITGGVMDATERGMPGEVKMPAEMMRAVLGNDTSCQWVAQYDFWRELCYFHEYAGASNACTLYCATGQSARMAGLGDVTGTLRPGLCADMLVTGENPLADLRALRALDMVVARGRIIDRPRPKRNARLDAGLDTLLA